MSEVTRILSALEDGDPHAAQQLLPLVYDELRKLAAHKIAQEKPGQTLNATALVHEAYLRLVGDNANQSWNSRGHFIATAAEAMRRILVEIARRKQSEKHGGKRKRIDLSQAEPILQADPDALLDLDAVLTLLADEDAEAAEVAKLRIFAGLSVEVTLRERLELFVSVCQAVQHVHQKGIIHRDLVGFTARLPIHVRPSVPA